VRRPQTLASVAAESSPLPSFRRREVARELRLEVSNSPVPLIEDLVHHGALSDLAELRRLDRAAPPHRAPTPPRLRRGHRPC
jgi:hypothetical protein